jgi:predicted dinucleotide-binding enzyme
MSSMTIGIIGADDRAVAIAKMLRGCGHQVSFSDPIHEITPPSAANAVGGGDVWAATAARQAAECDALFIMVHWEDLEQALAALGPYRDGIVIDTTRPPDLGERTSGAELLARKLDNHHVVKAFVEPFGPGDVIQVASDDPQALAFVEDMIVCSGCFAENVGPLSSARHMERHVTLPYSV